MPHRLNENRAKIQFITSAEMPSLIYEACLKRDLPSNTVYIQKALIEALSRDLDIPAALLESNLPSPQGRARALFDGQRQIQRRIGPSGAVEEVT